MFKNFKSGLLMNNIMIIISAFFSGLVLADTNVQHGNANAVKTAPQEYQDVYLTMDKDSNWETEYCLVAKKGTLKYHFEAPYITEFGTHLHDELGTEVQVKNALVREYEASVVIKNDGGDFCFTWGKTKKYAEDWPFQLRYWIIE